MTAGTQQWTGSATQQQHHACGVGRQCSRSPRGRVRHLICESMLLQWPVLPCTKVHQHCGASIYASALSWAYYAQHNAVATMVAGCNKKKLHTSFQAPAKHTHSHTSTTDVCVYVLPHLLAGSLLQTLLMHIILEYLPHVRPSADSHSPEAWLHCWHSPLHSQGLMRQSAAGTQAHGKGSRGGSILWQDITVLVPLTQM